ncbi:hypothetical protein [Pseudomonas paeninsulae]|uniref:hypothetical protein n=1 Tax=Pseudomonas paeninsulae TaxID=3110772 RepID=UPI002D78C4FA|nr:hypothetical protein [Pseudomonas sp. IT1137]
MRQFLRLECIVVCTGGALAYGRAALTLTKGRRSSLLMTFVQGVVIFVADCLNALTVDEAMKRVLDCFKSSREMLDQMVDGFKALLPAIGIGNVIAAFIFKGCALS